MPWPVTAAKGIASLFKKPKGAIKKGQEVLSPATQLRNAQSAKLFAQMNKKNYSDAFNKARARINDMNMSSAQKDDAVESLRTFYRNQHSEEMMRVANLGDLARQAPVTPVPDLVKQGLAFALGGGAGYGVAKNEEAIIDMLKSTKLPTKIDVDFGMTPAGEIFEGVEGDSNFDQSSYLLPYGALTKLGETLFKEGGAEEDLFPTEFDEVLEEPGLEEGSVGDLLIWNSLFRD